MSQLLNNSQATIIVVDDSDFTRKNIVNFLRSKNFNVVGDFNHAQPALEHITSNTTTVALIDVVLPEISGIELCQKITANVQRTKVIMMSSLAQERIILECIAAGAQDFLQKPINETHLTDAILRIVQNIST